VTLGLSLTDGRKTVQVYLRPDTAEYLSSTPTLDPKDWRVRDLLTACWAAAQQFQKPQTSRNT
jgi:hypothetical protein